MGATASMISAATTGAQVGFGFMQHQQNAQAASQRGRFANDVAERNAQLAERQGRDAINVGELEANRMRGQTDQEVSSGRAAAGAQGVDVNVGSPAAVTDSRKLVGDVDALTIRNNAARAAWGYDVEAANERMNGKLALLAGENEAAGERLSSVSTLLGGASSMYGLYKTRIPKSSPTAAAPVSRRADDPFYGPNQRPA
jgi:hypothetical protein